MISNFSDQFLRLLLFLAICSISLSVRAQEQSDNTIEHYLDEEMTDVLYLQKGEEFVVIQTPDAKGATPDRSARPLAETESQRLARRQLIEKANRLRVSTVIPDSNKPGIKSGVRVVSATENPLKLNDEQQEQLRQLTIESRKAVKDLVDKLNSIETEL